MAHKFYNTELNTRQWEAIVNNNRRLLVLAGAGSGKTKTLLQKIVHLVDNGISPSEILAITFTKNAANEMLDRLIETAGGEEQKRYKWIDKLTVKTFHSFCYSIMRNDGVKEFDNQFRIISDTKRNEDEELSKNTAPETVFEVLHKILIDQCNNLDFLLLLKRYILDYMVDRIHLAEPDVPRGGKYFTSLDGTKIRSKSEQFIMDWFYRHNLKCVYEPKLNATDDFGFHPDFFIPDANLYIEHVTDKSYPLKDKEKQFAKAGLHVVKTHESMTKDSALFNRTLEKATRSRLPDYKAAVMLNYNEEFNSYHDHVKGFLRQVIRVIDMIKVENLELEKVLEDGGKDQHERVRFFYELVGPVIKAYKQYCINKSYLDFNDLILRSISLFQHHRDIADKYRKKFRYILVDEFQDVNKLQVQLIKLLLTKTTQLFCVGDDWQSIYGFRGSDVTYIVEFEKHFPNAEVIKLNLNYRSTASIVYASNALIKHNKTKVDKDITAVKQSVHKIVLHLGNDEDENVQYCVEKIHELLKKGIEAENILFLYRRRKMYSAYHDYFKDIDLKVQAKTIHASKGLEAEAVFILGLTDGEEGFPNVWQEDRIFSVIKKANYDVLLEEERRLFYVAITRAQDRLFLITEKGNESGFIKELPETMILREGLHLQPVVENEIHCVKCGKLMYNDWISCPFCHTVRTDIA